MTIAERAVNVHDELGAGRLRHEILGVRLRHSKHDVGVETSSASTRHPHHELTYIETGEGTGQLGADLLRVRPGDVFLMPPETFHRHRDPAHFGIWALSFRTQLLRQSGFHSMSEALASGEPTRLSVPERDRAHWEARFRYLFSELNGERVPDEATVQAIVRSILLDFERISQGGGIRDISGRRRLLDAVFDYIDAHYREPVSLRDVAGEMNFSPAYLTDLVRRETGKPIHQWISERRLHAAQLSLAETDRSMATIAEDVGFRDSTYFGRLFAKRFGQTPRAWRETRRGNQDVCGSAGRWGLPPTSGAVERYACVRELGERLGELQIREDMERAVLDVTYASFAPSLAQILRRAAAKKQSTVVMQNGACDLAQFPPPYDVDGALPMVVDGQTVVAQDLLHSPQHEHRRIGQLGYHSLLIAPIMISSECVGAIRILERKSRAFSEHERLLLATIGVLAGLAMRRALPDRK